MTTERYEFTCDPPTKLCALCATPPLDPETFASSSSITFVSILSDLYQSIYMAQIDKGQKVHGTATSWGFEQECTKFMQTRVDELRAHARHRNVFSRSVFLRIQEHGEAVLLDLMCLLMFAKDQPAPRHKLLTAIELLICDAVILVGHYGFRGLSTHPRYRAGPPARTHALQLAVFRMLVFFLEPIRYFKDGCLDMKSDFYLCERSLYAVIFDGDKEDTALLFNSLDHDNIADEYKIAERHLLKR